MGVPCSRPRLWWWVGNCMHPLFQNQEREQTCSFLERKKATSTQKQTWWPHKPGSLLCSSAGKERRVVLLPYSRCNFLACWWGQEWHFVGEATFLWQKMIPQSWYPTAFGETTTGFHLSKPCPKLFSLWPLVLQWKNDSPSPKISGNGRFRMAVKKELYLLIYLFFSWADISSPGPQIALCGNSGFVLLWLKYRKWVNKWDAPLAESCRFWGLLYKFFVHMWCEEKAMGQFIPFSFQYHSRVRIDTSFLMCSLLC